MPAPLFLAVSVASFRYRCPGSQLCCSHHCLRTEYTLACCVRNFGIDGPTTVSFRWRHRKHWPMSSMWMCHESWPEKVSGWSYSKKFTQLLARLWLAFLPLPLDCCYPDFMLKWYDVPLGSCLSHVRRSMWTLWCDVVPGVIRKCIRVILLWFPCIVNDR